MPAANPVLPLCDAGLSTAASPLVQQQEGVRASLEGDQDVLRRCGQQEARPRVSITDPSLPHSSLLLAALLTIPCRHPLLFSAKRLPAPN